MIFDCLTIPSVIVGKIMLVKMVLLMRGTWDRTINAKNAAIVSIGL